MKIHTPRIILSGTSSGCGKTTVTCAVLSALVARGMKVSSFKCGPDYIDPMFHEKAIGTKGSNLDSFFYDDNTIRFLLARNSRDADICVIEGAMGFYDGRGIKTCEKSCYELSRTTNSPVVLIVNCKGMAYSVTALIRGFLEQKQDSGIVAVILNNVTKATAPLLAEAIEEQFRGRVKMLGYFPPMNDCVFESRHLGLITADEIGDIREKLNKLSVQAQESIDIDALISLANDAQALEYEDVAVTRFDAPVRIVVAMDRAFCFYYRDNLDLLESMGAKIVFFSPIYDRSLPECDGLYLGGGYPELYKAELSKNHSMRRSIKAALKEGLPCIAECGGFMYLTESIDGADMADVLPGRCENKGKLVRFGYLTLTAKRDNMLCRAGAKINVHAFHHYDAQYIGDGFEAQKSNGIKWGCVFATDSLYAGYPHLPFYSNTDFAKNFYLACLAKKEA